ncbi:helix-turn-helix domain-containing protein [Saccharothrix variisporea]|uniref:Helix-turn-helix protein n=1 Tax=Saccharothrix variisporea TaxID=543527 RepID=A0A495XLU5_9PSEU|nr:helix-turn-helix transcriptional regulator [Saccharothrix variisporea]RKT72578.1 helix-turn-helix protein [Saccharothrix variisporea]
MELSEWVADIAVERFGAGGTQAHGPDPATTLVFCSRSEEAFVLGPRTRGRYFAGVDAHRLLVRLRPGLARAVLGVGVRSLVDEVVPLRELWGVSVGGPAGLRSALASRLADLDPRSDALVASAAGLVLTSGVAGAAARLHVSERHLRGLFGEAVGLPPKQYARVERVRRAVASGGTGGWTRVAAELGYYDQSHLHAEFRATMGVAPGAFAAGRYPEAAPC